MSKATRFKETKRRNRYGATFTSTSSSPCRVVLHRAVIFMTKYPDKVELMLRKQSGKGVDVGVVGLGTGDAGWISDCHKKCNNTQDLGVIEKGDLI